MSGHIGRRVVSSTDGDERFVLIVPRQARELVFVKLDVARDDNLVRLLVVALVALVAVLKA